MTIYYNGISFEITAVTAERFYLKDNQEVKDRYEFERIIKFNTNANKQDKDNEGQSNTGQKTLF